MASLEPLMGQNFIEYASYVIVDRAIPDLRDGLKPVQRRILATLQRMDDGSFHKVANVIGSTMKLHPHGDASIGDALVVLANKDYFIERQGNFGSPLTGHAAAAPRYIECRLTELARDTMFNPALTETRPSYDGRNDEPVFLPSKLPVALLIGAEGIAVGMATRILPHNFGELLRAQIDLLEGREIDLVPDFPTGGIIDASEYDQGRGRVRVRARIETPDDKTIVIREVPYGTTTESLIASIEAAVAKGRLKVASIDDFTTEQVEIQIGLPRNVYAEEVLPQLYAHTDCEVSISSSLVLIRGRRPVQLTVPEVLAALTEQLKERLRAELELELHQLGERAHWLSLERIFIENRIYKRIEEARTAEAVRQEILDGLAPFVAELPRPVSEDDLKRLLDIPIRRISRYDLDRTRKELDEVAAAAKRARAKLRRLVATTVEYLDGLLERYAARWPRRSEVRSFEVVDLRRVARQNLRVAYDPATGFFGTEVKGDQHQLTVSEYDRILIVTSDGTYRIVAPPERLLLPAKVLHLARFDEQQGQAFTVVYRMKDRTAFAKKVHIRSFIRDKEYELVRVDATLDLLLPGYAEGTLELDFVPRKRQRVNKASFALADVKETGVTARGTRLASKGVARIKLRRERKGANGDEPAPENGGGTTAAEPEPEPEAPQPESSAGDGGGNGGKEGDGGGRGGGKGSGGVKGGDGGGTPGGGSTPEQGSLF